MSIRVTQQIVEIEWFAIAAPTNVAAVCDLANCHIDITWTDNELYEHGYRIYRSVDGGAFTLLVDNLAPDTVAYEDSAIGADVGCQFAYGVVCFIDDIESDRVDSTPISCCRYISVPQTWDDYADLYDSLALSDCYRLVQR